MGRVEVQLAGGCERPQSCIWSRDRDWLSRLVRQRKWGYVGEIAVQVADLEAQLMVLEVLVLSLVARRSIEPVSAPVLKVA